MRPRKARSAPFAAVPRTICRRTSMMLGNRSGSPSTRKTWALSNMSLASLMKTAEIATARLLASAFVLVGLGLPASALVEIDVNRGNIEPLPIAISNFSGSGDDTQVGADIAGVITADLKRSGIFA